MARQLRRWLFALLLLPALLSAESYDTDGFDATNAFDSAAWDLQGVIGEVGGIGKTPGVVGIKGVGIGL